MLRYNLILLLFIGANAFSQTNYEGKLSASLKYFLTSIPQDERFLFKKNDQLYVPVFLEMTDSNFIGALSKTGIQFRTVIGNIATADIPLNDVRRIASLPEIKRIELPLLFRKTDSIMLKMTKADKVLSGEAPLARAYSGKNVLIGIIDDGVDITHKDFQDSNGKTRLKALWNMDAPGLPPSGYFYGRLLTEDTLNYYINLNKSIPINPYKLQGIVGYAFHGSSVAGLAAGKNGIAPGADIVAVALTAFADTLLRSDRIIDAISFIYTIAKQREKKCIINISLGVMDGAPHDGKSMVERAIDNFCLNKTDILVCTSAGNNGNSWKHWGGFPIHPDSSFGFFRCAYKASIYFSIPKAFSPTLKISLTESKLGNINNPNIRKDSIYYQTPFVNISNLIQNSIPLSFNSYLRNGAASSTITFTASHYNNEYDELIITTDEHTSGTPGNPVFDDHLYRFIFKGSGIVHAWYPFLNLHPIYFFGQNPYPNDPTYHGTDNEYTTVIPTHAFTVLSSGAYNIRNCYVNAQNKAATSYPSCQLTYFTSHGPTLDGRIKPDILSPGENVIAPRSKTQTYFWYGDEVDSSRYYFGGTSASSPITAGVAALVWERFPLFTRDSVINRIKSTAYSDPFTLINGPLPNNVAGWGKIDAFKAVSGVTANVELMCSPVECKSIIDPPPPIQPSYHYYIHIYPNPASNQITIQYTSPVSLQLKLYNTIGQLIKVENLPSSLYTINKNFNITNLPSEVYFIKIAGGKFVFKDKILVIR